MFNQVVTFDGRGRVIGAFLFDYGSWEKKLGGLGGTDNNVFVMEGDDEPRERERQKGRKKKKKKREAFQNSLW